MYEVNGVGLAAPQIGVSKQISVIDTNGDKVNQIVLVNPEIIELGDDVVLMEEGCLSVPGAYAKVPRATRAKVRAQNADGETFEMEAEGLLAEAFQHEIDHLNGKLFIELLSSMKRSRAIRQLEKFKKQQAKKS